MSVTCFSPSFARSQTLLPDKLQYLVDRGVVAVNADVGQRVEPLLEGQPGSLGCTHTVVQLSSVRVLADASAGLHQLLQIQFHGPEILLHVLHTHILSFCLSGIDSAWAGAVMLPALLYSFVQLAVIWQLSTAIMTAVQALQMRLQTCR